MNKLLTLLATAVISMSAAAEVTINIYDHVTFYDGYLVDNIPEDAPDEGCTRLYTYLCTKQLTDEQINTLGEHLTMDVRVHALCDNYDRIGSVNLTLIPKGQQSYSVKYDDSDPLRIEVARFITPFMNKNKEPSTVPYTYSLDYLSNILRDSRLREAYDFWLELMIFGVPYAAQTQVKGCAGCNDVFQGSVDFVTDDTPGGTVDTGVLVPITIRTADWRADRGMNNYNEACTDEIGRTIKTFTYTVSEDCVDGRVVLIMSNHGAGNNGEEYNRRMHYVYSDGAPALEFKPGRTSCEPFRQYNTQSNGIYGTRPRTDAQWQSFSNWCPGDVIDCRYIEMGPVTAGEHSITIDVPDAKFAGSDGYFPVSLYFQGDTANMLPAGIEAVDADGDYTTLVDVRQGCIMVSAPEYIDGVELYTVSGELVTAAAGHGSAMTLDTTHYDHGIYVVVVHTPTLSEAHKISI